MSKPVSQRRFHYYNPIQEESLHSAHLFAIPRLCGCEFNLPCDHYGVSGLSRGSHLRALFKYTISGAGSLRLGEHFYRLNPGSAMLLTGPSDYDYFLAPDADHWEFLFISFWHPIAVGAMEDIIRECGHVIELDPRGRTLADAWGLYELFRNGAITDKYLASCRGYDFLMQLCHEAVSAGPAAPDQAAALLREVANYCARHLPRPITVTELADFCHYSRSHFAKAFHQAAGEPPSHYILRTKLAAALQLLRHENLSIKEAAFRCGFQDQGYFTRRFHARYGVPPSRFSELGNT